MSPVRVAAESGAASPGGFDSANAFTNPNTNSTASTIHTNLAAVVMGTRYAGCQP